MEQHLFPMIPHCLKQPGLLETQHILIIHFYLERNIRIQDYHMWAKLFLCTFFGGHISFRMFIKGHLCQAATGLHHTFLSVRKTVS